MDMGGGVEKKGLRWFRNAMRCIDDAFIENVKEARRTRGGTNKWWQAGPHHRTNVSRWSGLLTR